MEYGQGQIFEAVMVELHWPPCSRQKATLVIKIMSIFISYDESIKIYFQFNCLRNFNVEPNFVGHFSLNRNG